MSTTLVTTDKQYLEPFFTENSAIISFDEYSDITFSDFDRIELSGSSFLVPTGEGDKTTSLPHLEAIICYSHPASTLYLTPPSDGEGEPPHAYSDDGVTQVVTSEGLALAKSMNLPEPLTNLTECPYNQWGSAAKLLDPSRNETAKATKDVRRLYLLLPGEVLPSVLTLPPTSLKNFKDFRLKRASRSGGVTNILTKLTCTPQVRGSFRWSVVEFAVLGELNRGDVERVAWNNAFVQEVLANSRRSNDVIVPAVETTNEAWDTLDGIANKHSDDNIPF